MIRRPLPHVKPVSCPAPLRTRTFHAGGEVSTPPPILNSQLHQLAASLASAAVPCHLTCPTSQNRDQSSGALIYTYISPSPGPPTYPIHLLTSSSLQSGCLGHRLGYGSPKNNLENRNTCEQSQGRQDATGSCHLSPAKPLLMSL